MRFTFITILSCFMALKSFSANFEIKSYRFHSHIRENYDRLVLEMAKINGTETPLVKVTNESASEALIEIQNAKLVGAIPESSINNSFMATSRYLGPITFNNDSPANSFSIKLWLKKTDSDVDAFWQDAAGKLVVDVYPKNSLRAKGLNQLHDNRNTASVSAPKIKCNNEELPKYLCFPASARVGLKVKFDVSPYLKTKIQAIPVQLGTIATSSSFSSQDAIVCYPSIARVTPSFTFEAFVEPEQLSNEVFHNEQPMPQTNISNPESLLRQPTSNVQSTEGINTVRENEEDEDALPVAPPPSTSKQLPPSMLLSPKVNN